MTTGATSERVVFDGLCAGAIARPDDAAYDAARQDWKPAVQARPALRPLLKETDR
jgi:hypothetical protein